MTEQEAFETLRSWAAANGLLTDGIGGEDWTASAYRNVWILTPPGRSNALYCVSTTEVRALHPSRDSVKEVLEAMSPNAG